MPEDVRQLPTRGPGETDPRTGESILREWARQGASGAATAMAEAERHRLPPPGAVPTLPRPSSPLPEIPGIAGPAGGSGTPSDFEILIGRGSNNPFMSDILTERERRLLRERPSELDRLLASGPEDDFLRGEEKKAARARRADTRGLSARIPGIRGPLSTGGAIPNPAAIEAQFIIWDLLRGHAERDAARLGLGRDFPADPGRRGRPGSTERAIARARARTNARSRTNRTGIGATRVPKPAPAPSNSRSPPREPPSSTGTIPGTARELPPRGDPVKRTQRGAPRTTTRPTTTTTTPRGVFGIPGRPGMPDLIDLLLDRSPARARTPMRASAGGGGPTSSSFAPTSSSPLSSSPGGGLAPPSSPATAAPGLTPFESPLLGLSTQTQMKAADCDCPKPTKTKRKFDCSNPLVSRSVSEKDGIITIKRKLVCPPSNRKSPSRTARPTPTS